jgi:hypothetical protein
MCGRASWFVFFTTSHSIDKINDEMGGARGIKGRERIHIGPWDLGWKT